MAFHTLRSKCALLAPLCLLVLGAAGNAAADTITLGWDQSSSTVGYRVHVGTQSGSYTQHFDAGASNVFAFTSATAGQRYCFAVSAYTLSSQVEGPNSSEVCGYSNEAPTLVNPGSRTSTVGQPTSLQLQGFDSQPLTYSHGGLPPGLSMMSSTGYISGTGTTAGSYMVTVIASDGTLSARQTFTWTMTTSSTSSSTGGTTTTDGTTTTPTGCTTATVSICTPTTGTSFSTTQSSITLTGSASPAITRVVWENSPSGVRGVASGTTSWTIANIPLQAGTNVIEITAYDGAGNPSTDRLSVTRSSTTSSTGGGTTTTPPPSTSGPDSTSPTVTITSPTSASTYSTNASSLSLSGTASDNVAVTQVRWQNDTMRLVGIASGLTNWTASVPLQAGSNSISILAFDAAGNIGFDSFTVTVSSTGTGSTGGTTSPTVSIVTPTTGDSYSTTQSSINLTGSASSVVTRVVWENSANGARGVASGTTSWAIANIPLQAGTNVIDVTAYDAAGNRFTDRLLVTSSSTTSSTGGGTTTTPPPSTSGPDSTSPTATIVSPTSGSTYSTNASSLSLSGTASDNVAVTQVRWQNDTMRLVGIASGLTNWTASVPLQAGSNSISILAFDAAGNIGFDSFTVTVSSTSTGSTGCATTSTVSICTPTTGTSFATTQSSINMTGTAPSVVTRVVWENVANGARGVASGTTSWSIANIPLLAGSNLIEVTAYDGAGNPSIDRLLVTR